MRRKFQSEIRRGRDHLGDQGVDGMIILKCIFKNSVSEGMDWIQLASIYTAMNFRGP
jgi:hypothetical protein